jgi:hypothetical protein
LKEAQPLLLLEHRENCASRMHRNRALNIPTAIFPPGSSDNTRQKDMSHTLSSRLRCTSLLSSPPECAHAKRSNAARRRSSLRTLPPHVAAGFRRFASCRMTSLT